MTVQVELSDLEQVVAALDAAITGIVNDFDEPDPASLVSVLELVQTYIDNAQEGTDGEVSDGTAAGDNASAESQEPVAEDDIPF